MSLLDTIQQDMKSALRAGEKLELGALRMLVAAIKRKQIDERAELSDAGVLSLIEKLIKQGRDAQQQFESGGRAELAAKEASEIAVFERYLPSALRADEIDALIRHAIRKTGAADIKDMGKVMAEIKTAAAGRVDMAAVGASVRAILSGA